MFEALVKAKEEHDNDHRRESKLSELEDRANVIFEHTTLSEMNFRLDLSHDPNTNSYRARVRNPQAWRRLW